MKLRAIRLKEFRRFAEPVAIEGLSGELDVLAAPNEDGKSTLFDAVRTVFGEKYNAGARSNKMKQIQPYAGGTPLIEVDFDFDGRAYRLRKQYIRRTDALLSDRQTGKDIARKDDVEAWLREHLTDRGPLGLFWVAQQGSLTPVLRDKAGAENVPALRQVIEAEVGAIAGGRERDAVRAAVQADLDGLITTRGVARKNSTYANALEHQNEVSKRLENAWAQREKLESYLNRLEELGFEKHDLTTSESYLARAERIETAKSHVEAAERAAAQLRDALKEEETAKLQSATAAERLAALDGIAKRCKDGEKYLEIVGQKIAALRREQETAEAERDSLVKKQKVAATALETLRREEWMRHAETERASRQGELEKKRKTRDEALALQKQLTALETAIKKNAATPERLRTLEHVSANINALTMSIERQTPSVLVQYEGGTSARIHVDGDVLNEGEPFAVAQTTDFLIDGVGRMTVDPGAASELGEDRDDLKALEAQRAELLAACGASTLEDVRTQLTERSALSAKRDVTQERLANLLPDGMDAFQQEIADEERELANTAPSAPETYARSADEIAQALEQQGKNHDERTQLLNEQQAVVQDILVRQSALQADMENGKKILADLNGQLERNANGEPVGKDENRKQLSEALTTAEQRLADASRQVGLWRTETVTVEELDRRRTALTDVTNAAEASNEALRAIDQERREIEAVLRETMGDGLDAEIDKLTGELERAEKAVAHHEHHIAALQLLRDTLDNVARETRETYTKPIVTRLGPYLETVFPGAQLTFMGDLSADGLSRTGLDEAFDNVSLGTQEQISVLVRLGFAKLFADQGTPWPLILDDALVYSDDARIERMFAALQSAASAHQVLVLTCRTRAFQNLGGTQLSIKPAPF